MLCLHSVVCVPLTGLGVDTSPISDTETRGDPLPLLTVLCLALSKVIVGDVGGDGRRGEGDGVVLAGTGG
jgi:hypothetical protein